MTHAAWARVNGLRLGDVWTYISHCRIGSLHPSEQCQGSGYRWGFARSVSASAANDSAAALAAQVRSRVART